MGDFFSKLILLQEIVSVLLFCFIALFGLKFYRWLVKVGGAISGGIIGLILGALVGVIIALKIENALPILICAVIGVAVVAILGYLLSYKLLLRLIALYGFGFGLVGWLRLMLKFINTINLRLVGKYDGILIPFNFIMVLLVAICGAVAIGWLLATIAVLLHEPFVLPVTSFGGAIGVMKSLLSIIRIILGGSILSVPFLSASIVWTIVRIVLGIILGVLCVWFQWHNYMRGKSIKQILNTLTYREVNGS